MSIDEKLKNLAVKVKQQSDNIQTEEATKNAFVMPFIHSVLGYDVFDPTEVIPEYICDVGTKKGEKIDYAILKNGEVQILVECKKIGEDLKLNHASQLFRYFHTTSSRIAILTNGKIYKFFTDLDSPNKMDEKPFLELDILDIDDYIVPELLKLTKNAFDIESIINAAGELKYVSQIKKLLSGMLSSPDDDFIKLIASRVYDGVVTQKVRELFLELTKKASTQFINDQVNERLKSAISGVVPTYDIKKEEKLVVDSDEEQGDTVTTEEEIEGYMITKAILRRVIDVNRIFIRDAKSYCSVLLDDNNRKPICRMHFNRTQKYIGIFDEDKKENRIAIDCLNDIYNYEDNLIKTIELYS